MYGRDGDVDDVQAPQQQVRAGGDRRDAGPVPQQLHDLVRQRQRRLALGQLVARLLEVLLDGARGRPLASANRPARARTARAAARRPRRTGAARPGTGAATSPGVPRRAARSARARGRRRRRRSAPPGSPPMSSPTTGVPWASREARLAYTTRDRARPRHHERLERRLVERPHEDVGGDLRRLRGRARLRQRRGDRDARVGGPAGGDQRRGVGERVAAASRAGAHRHRKAVAPLPGAQALARQARQPGELRRGDRRVGPLHRAGSTASRGRMFQTGEHGHSTR